jgi:outer membrane lipoprotein carrier protein
MALHVGGPSPIRSKVAAASGFAWPAALPPLLAVAAALLALLPAAAAPSAEAVAQRVEQHHAQVADLTARFEQSYRSGVLGREIVERGVVSIKRPGRMLWEYKDPEKKTFVSDGKQFYFYVPADKQVVVRDQAGQRGVLAQLLSGQGKLLADFQVSLVPGAGDASPRLRLVPRKEDPDVQEVVLDVDAESRIRGIEVRDAQGNQSRFRFEEIHENVGLSDRMFHFELPHGVEVITG